MTIGGGTNLKDYLGGDSFLGLGFLLGLGGGGVGWIDVSIFERSILSEK